jgi:hypothetical protein
LKWAVKGSFFICNRFKGKNSHINVGHWSKKQYNYITKESIHTFGQLAYALLFLLVLIINGNSKLKYKQLKKQFN